MRLKLAVAFLMTVGATVPVVLTGSQPVSAAGKLTPSERRCFEVSGDPSEAALVNLTPVLADAGGDGQLVSSDVSSPPVASNVNFRPGAVDPNVAVASIGGDGQVCFVNSVHTNVHLVADHLGTIASSVYTPATPSGAPDRRVDTRSGLGGGKIGSSERRCFSVNGDPGDAAIVNLTPVLAEAPGDGQLVSSDVTSPPVASNVNYRPGTVDPNVAIAKVGADGRVCFVNSVHSNVHLVADHLGTIASSAYAPAKASGAPDRRVDTRSGLGGGKIGPSGRRCFSVSGNPGDAAVVNLTPVSADGAGDGQLISSDVTDAPVASNVNFRPGSVDPNVAIAKIGSDGQVCYVNSTHASVHLVADHLGTIAGSMYTPATTSGAPDRRVDTRGERNDCDGIFVARPGTPRVLADVSETPIFRSVPLPTYDYPFEDGGIMVAGGCKVYYVEQAYRASSIVRVTFNRDGVTATDRFSTPESLSSLGRPRLIGVDADQRHAWVWAEEGGVVGAPPTVWRIPLGDGQPTRIVSAPDCIGQPCAMAISGDGTKVYWRSLDSGLNELGFTEYDTTSGVRRRLPSTGNCAAFDCVTRPMLLLSPDGKRLCAGGVDAYVDVRSGAARDLALPCRGFDRGGNVVTLIPNEAETEVAIGIMSHDQDESPVIISRVETPIYSYPLLHSDSVG